MDGHQINHVAQGFSQYIDQPLLRSELFNELLFNQFILICSPNSSKPIFPISFSICDIEVLMTACEKQMSHVPQSSSDQNNQSLLTIEPILEVNTLK